MGNLLVALHDVRQDRGRAHAHGGRRLSHGFVVPSASVRWLARAGPKERSVVDSLPRLYLWAPNARPDPKRGSADGDRPDPAAMSLPDPVLPGLVFDKTTNLIKHHPSKTLLSATSTKPSHLTVTPIHQKNPSFQASGSPTSKQALQSIYKGTESASRGCQRFPTANP